MSVRLYGEVRTFDQAISDQLQEDVLKHSREEPNYRMDYVVFGEYGRILAEYYRLFSPSNIKILYMNDLVRDPALFMKSIFDFIGVEGVELPNLGKIYHDANTHWFLTRISNIVLGTRVRTLGKIIPLQARRPLRFWFGLHRNFRNKGVDDSMTLSLDTREKFIDIYRKDALVLMSCTGSRPYWVESW